MTITRYLTPTSTVYLFTRSDGREWTVTMLRKASPWPQDGKPPSLTAPGTGMRWLGGLVRW